MLKPNQKCVCGTTKLPHRSSFISQSVNHWTEWLLQSGKRSTVGLAGIASLGLTKVWKTFRKPASAGILSRSGLKSVSYVKNRQMSVRAHVWSTVIWNSGVGFQAFRLANSWSAVITWQQLQYVRIGTACIYKVCSQHQDSRTIRHGQISPTTLKSTASQQRTHPLGHVRIQIVQSTSPWSLLRTTSHLRNYWNIVLCV